MIPCEALNTSQPLSGVRPWVWGLLLFILALVAYLPATRCGFIWDDADHVTSNPVIVGPLGLKEIWTTSHARICPLVLTTFWVEHKLWGVNPMPYHVVNILMHAAAALALWRVLLQLKVPGAWLGAAIWMLHPVQVESAAWITEMKNTESAFFFLLSVLFFCKSRTSAAGSRQHHPSNLASFHYSLSLLFGAMAMACKSSAVVLPLVLWLCAWWMEGRWNLRRNLRLIAPLLLLSALSAALSVWTQKVEGAGEAEKWALPILLRVAVAGRAPWFYLGKLIWPHPLITIYPRWEITFGSLAVWMPLIASVILSVFLWRNRNNKTGLGRALFMTWFYFVTALLPVMGLLNHGFLEYTFVADHFQYLASMGPLALLGAGISLAMDAINQRNRWLKPMLCSSLLVTLGVLTWLQCPMYKDSITIWAATVRNNPGSWAAHYNIGNLALPLEATPGTQNQIDEAIVHYKKTIELKPEFERAHLNLGILLQKCGRMDEAFAHFKKALEIKPGFAEAHLNLGTWFEKNGRMDEAIAQLQKSLDINPRFTEAHLNLGIWFEKTGRNDEAIAHFQKAVEIKPESAFARDKLSAALKAR